MSDEVHDDQFPMLADEGSIADASCAITELIFGYDGDSGESDDVCYQIREIINTALRNSHLNKRTGTDDPEDNPTPLNLFGAFAQILFDVEEPEADWQNRLGWAWDALDKFAAKMGPDYEKAVAAFWQRA